MAFNVYISHDTSPWELANVYALAKEAQERGIEVFIPDRNRSSQGTLPEHIAGALSRDVMVLFATQGGHYLEWVNSELRNAGGKRVLAVVEPGIPIQGILPVNIVSLERENLAKSVTMVINRLESFRLSKDVSNIMAGFVIGSLALLVLRAMGKQE